MSGICDYTGFGDSVTSFLCEAGSGNLSQADVNSIKQQGATDIAKAAAGMQPATVQAIIDRNNDSIDQLLGSFALPGETGQDVGASPQQASLRVAGTGNITLAKLKDALPSLPNLTNIKYYALIFGGVALLAIAFPYIAPVIARNVKAARSI